jgi:hypothetical protein
MGVDEDIGHRRISEQRFERTQAEYFVHHFLNDAFSLL